MYWPAAGATHDGGYFTRTAAHPDRRHRVGLWSGVMGTPVPNGPPSLLSLGMAQLGLPDLYLVAPDTQPLQILTTFFDLLIPLAFREKPMGDGTTIRFTDGRTLTGRLAESPIDPDQRVWRVDL